MGLLLSVSSIGSAIHSRSLSLVAIPEFARDEGFSGLEIDDRMLDRYEPGAVEQLAVRCRQAGSTLILSVNADLAVADPSLRAFESRHLARWIRRAGGLGIRTVRLCVGGQSLSVQKLIRRASATGPPLTAGDRPPASSGRWLGALAHRLRSRGRSPRRGRAPKTQRVVEELRRFAADLDGSRITIGIENHWGVTSRPEDLLGIVDRIDSPRVGVCLDFHNFPRDVDRYSAAARLAHRVRHVHAHCRGFDASGEERWVDYRRCLGILRKAAYDGEMTVEYQGPGDTVTGTRRARELIERHLASPNG